MRLMCIILPLEPSCSHFLRCCGHLFLCGDDEAAMKSTIFLAVDGEILKVNTTSTAEVQPKKWSKNKGAANQGSESSASHPRALSLPTNHEDYSLDNELLGDFLVPAIGGVVRRSEESLRQDMMKRQDLQDKVRKDILGMLLRMARRVYWSYMRQLWDETCDALISADERDEIVHRQVTPCARELDQVA